MLGVSPGSDLIRWYAWSWASSMCLTTSPASCVARNRPGGKLPRT